MLKILFPTDYSATANNAFLYALQVCKNYQGEILVLHSYSPNIVSGSIPYQLVESAHEGHALGVFDFYKEQVNQMRQLAEENGLSEVSLKFLMEEGELLQNIQNIVAKEIIDVIVMGTTGNSGLENKILGSQTAAVIKNVNIPVLSIPYLCRFEGIDAIGFTTIYDAEDAKVLQSMLPFVKVRNTDIYCVHINTDNEKYNAEKSASWKEQFKSEPVVFVEKNDDDIVKAVFDFVEEYSIDMVSCVTRNKSFFERLFESSIAQKLSYHKRIPLLTFHENMFK